MKWIKLTTTDGTACRINAEWMASYNVHGNETTVCLGGEPNGYFSVRETPEEIDAMLYDVRQSDGDIVVPDILHGLAKRIVDCLNACAGMDDPAAEIAEKGAEIDRLRARVRAVEIERDWEIDKKRSAIAGTERRDEELAAAVKRAEEAEEIAHQAWHLLDDSEDRGNEIVVDMDRFHKLAALIPEEHPSAYLAAVAKDKQEEGRG